MSQVVIAAEIKKERVGGDSESERRIKKREKRYCFERDFSSELKSRQ